MNCFLESYETSKFSRFCALNYMVFWLSSKVYLASKSENQENRDEMKSKQLERKL